MERLPKIIARQWKPTIRPHFDYNTDLSNSFLNIHEVQLAYFKYHRWWLLLSVLLRAGGTGDATMK